jgi:NAD(P)-dependent dehydrogenase (short-subunit alcohol dehydrogenase family)
VNSRAALQHAPGQRKNRYCDGADSGISRAAAVVLAREGAGVVVTDVSVLGAGLAGGSAAMLRRSASMRLTTFSGDG